MIIFSASLIIKFATKAQRHEPACRQARLKNALHFSVCLGGFVAKNSIFVKNSFLTFNLMPSVNVKNNMVMQKKF